MYVWLSCILMQGMPFFVSSSCVSSRLVFLFRSPFVCLLVCLINAFFRFSGVCLNDKNDSFFWSYGYVSVLRQKGEIIYVCHFIGLTAA